MELKRTKLFSSICIILSAVAVIFTVLLVILLNLGIGYTAVEGDSGEQAAQAIVGVIFVALLLIVLCGVAVFSALSGSISLILASKGKRPKPLLITGAVIKFLSAPLGFWLAGAVGFAYAICFVLLGVFDVLSCKTVKNNRTDV